MIANTAFTYIPVLVAWSSVKRFGGNPLLGIFLGLVLINDQLLPITNVLCIQWHSNAGVLEHIGT